MCELLDVRETRRVSLYDVTNPANRTFFVARTFILVAMLHPLFTVNQIYGLKMQEQRPWENNKVSDQLYDIW